MKKPLFLLLVAAVPAAAQAPRPKGICYQAAPRDRCGSFLLTEFGAGYRLAANLPESRATLFQYGLGAVRNVSSRAGIGGALLFTWSEEAITVGIAPRLRYWATPWLSFDLAPGLIVFQGGSRNLGLNAQVAANFGPQVSLTSTLQVTNLGHEQFEQVEWFVGTRLNGKVGTIAGLATPVLTILTYVLLFAPRSD